MAELTTIDCAIIAACLVLVVAAISAVLHKWDTMAIFAVVFAVLSVGLYFTWYRKLQGRDEARRQWVRDGDEAASE